MKHYVKNKGLLVRILMMFGGAFVLGVAIALCEKTKWGADPITVFYEGLASTFNISMGSASNVTAFLMIAIVVFIERKQLGIGTLLTPIFTQFGIEIGMLLQFSSLAIYESMFLFALGLICIAFGISTNMSAQLGKSSYDALIVSFMNKSDTKYHIIRWCIDSILLVSGILMGGVLTIGTPIAILALGKMITFFNQCYTKKVYGRIQ